MTSWTRGSAGRARAGGLIALFIAALAPAAIHADDWPQFRGAHQGTSPETGLPVKWSATSNVKWSTALPGAGHSSPIVWGDRIFLTAYPQPGFIQRWTRSNAGPLSVLCLDRKSGRILWERQVTPPAIEEVHPTNNPASPTPVTDGKLVYVVFGSVGLLAYDFEGRKVWEKPLGPFPNEWGSASSPILYQNLVILNVDSDAAEDFLLAVDKATGRTVWRTRRSGARSWPTPMIWNANGKDEIVVSGSERVKAYDPADGRELWTVDGLTHWVSPTPVSAHGLLFVASNGPGGNVILAIRPGGRGRITDSHVAWRYQRSAPYVPSPVIAGDYLFSVKNGGVMTCLNAKTGELMWQQRLPAGGDYYASPIAADGRIYTLSEDGVVTVLAAKPAYEPLSTNDMGERCMATPAVSGGQIFIRTDERLFAIGEPR